MDGEWKCTASWKVSSVSMVTLKATDMYGIGKFEGEMVDCIASLKARVECIASLKACREVYPHFEGKMPCMP